jgi:hypothetical protein
MYVSRDRAKSSGILTHERFVDASTDTQPDVIVHWSAISILSNDPHVCRNVRLMRRMLGRTYATTSWRVAYNCLHSRWYQSAVSPKAGRITAAGMTKGDAALSA